jgi:hypothetical protein
MLFTAMCRFFVEKKFGENNKASKPLYVSLGLVMSVALTTWAVKNNFALLNLGPWVMFILLVTVIFLVMSMRKKGEGKKDLDWAEIFALIAIMLILAYLMFPNLMAFLTPYLGGYLGLLWWFLIAAAIAVFLIKLLSWATGKVKKKKPEEGGTGGGGGGGGEPPISKEPKEMEWKEVCKKTGLLPNEYCERVDREFEKRKVPRNICQKCNLKSFGIRGNIIIMDKRTRAPSDEANFIFGDVLEIMGFLNKELKEGIRVIFKWSIEDSLTGKYILLPTENLNKFKESDSDSFEFPTNSLNFETGEKKKICKVRLIIIDPKLGNILDTTEKKFTVLKKEEIDSEPKPEPNNVPEGSEVNIRVIKE